MTMRFFSGLILLLISNICFSQDHALVNTWGKGSRFIYIGVSNELKQSENNRILSASSAEASVSISADSTSLIVKPRLSGPVTITLGTQQDSLTLVFQSTYLPLPLISLGDASPNASTLSTAELANAKGLKLNGDDKDDANFFEGCSISCCELQIGDELYTFSGESFTDEIKNAFSKLTEGEKVIVRRMILQVKSTGKIIKLDPGRRFIVKN